MILDYGLKAVSAGLKTASPFELSRGSSTRVAKKPVHL